MNAQPKRRTVARISDAEVVKLERAMEFMKANFRTARLADIAAEAGLSVFHFHRRFTLWAGRTPKAVLTEHQLAYATQLLRAGRLTLCEVATRAGFAHQSHFTHRFRSLIGEPPGRWQQRVGQAREVSTEPSAGRTRKAA